MSGSNRRGADRQTLLQPSENDRFFAQLLHALLPRFFFSVLAGRSFCQKIEPFKAF